MRSQHFLKKKQKIATRLEEVQEGIYQRKQKNGQVRCTLKNLDLVIVLFYRNHQEYKSPFWHTLQTS